MSIQYIVTNLSSEFFHQSVCCHQFVKKNAMRIKSCMVDSLLKTHFPDLRFSIDRLFERAIVLIRSPTDAIFSFAHLQFTKSHVEMAPDSHFTGEKFYRSLKPLCLKWKKFYSYWLGYQKYQRGPVFNGPVFPVLYEHLNSGGSESRKQILGRLSQFLELNGQHLFVNCTDCEGAASYYRHSPLKAKHGHSLRNDSRAMEILARFKCLAMYEEIVLQYASAANARGMA